MKEVKLIKMQNDLKLTQKALAVALYKIEKIEEKINDNGRENTEDTKL
jgi:hypothetical protein